jgi:hypothetical protein
MVRWNTAAVWGWGVVFAAGLGAMGGLWFGVARVDGDVKDVVAAGLGAAVAVAGAGWLQANATRAAAVRERRAVQDRRAALHELVRLLNRSAVMLMHAQEEASRREARCFRMARELADETLAAWHPVSLFSPFANLDSVRTLGLLARVDSVCRRLEVAAAQCTARASEAWPENSSRPLKSPTPVEAELSYKLVTLGGELSAACSMALADLHTEEMPDFMKRMANAGGRALKRSNSNT